MSQFEYFSSNKLTGLDNFQQFLVLKASLSINSKKFKL